MWYPINRFSVNFCLDCCAKPSYVAYHFKTIFDSNSVVHNYKKGTWQDEIHEENTWIDGPGNYELFKSKLLSSVN